MAKRKNGEGTWGTKTIKGNKYQFYRNVNGKYFYGKTIKEIKEKIKQYEEKESTNIPEEKDIKKMCFGDYILTWLKDKKNLSIKENTIIGYENCIMGQIIKYEAFNLNGIQVGTLTTDILQNYYNSLTNHYTKSTIKKNYAIISQCIKYGNKRKHFAETIDLDDIVLPHDDVVIKKKREISFLTDDDMKKIYKESKRVNVPGFNWGGKIGESTYGNNANLIVFILYTGLRVSEAIGLQWNNVDIQNKKITVINNATLKGKNSSTKTPSGTRTIPLNDIAFEIINIENKLNPSHNDNDYVFITKNGGKIASRHNINRTLQKMINRAGCSVDKLSPHELRHSFGSALLRKGVDIKIVSKLLGHKDITVTYNVYIHILNEQEVTAINILNDINKI